MKLVESRARSRREERRGHYLSTSVGTCSRICSYHSLLVHVKAARTIVLLCVIAPEGQPPDQTQVASICNRLGDPMRAAFLKTEGRLVMIDAQMPTIQSPDQILIKVKTVGICGSEVHASRGSHPFTRHELDGLVQARTERGKQDASSRSSSDSSSAHDDQKLLQWKEISNGTQLC
jgi:hypothetical protein